MLRAAWSVVRARCWAALAESHLALVQPNPTETRAPNPIAGVYLADPSSCGQHTRVLILVGIVGLLGPRAPAAVGLQQMRAARERRRGA